MKSLGPFFFLPLIIIIFIVSEVGSSEARLERRGPWEIMHLSICSCTFVLFFFIYLFTYLFVVPPALPLGIEARTRANVIISLDSNPRRNIRERKTKKKKDLLLACILLLQLSS